MTRASSFQVRSALARYDESQYTTHGLVCAGLRRNAEDGSSRPLFHHVTAGQASFLAEPLTTDVRRERIGFT